MMEIRIPIITSTWSEGYCEPVNVPQGFDEEKQEAAVLSSASEADIKVIKEVTLKPDGAPEVTSVPRKVSIRSILGGKLFSLDPVTISILAVVVCAAAIGWAAYALYKSLFPSVERCIEDLSKGGKKAEKAKAALLRMGEKAVPLLANFIEKGDGLKANGRAAAIYVLGDLKGLWSGKNLPENKVAGVIRSGLTSKDREVRIAAMCVLKETGDEQAVDNPLKAAEEGDDYERLLALGILDSLGRAGDARAVEMIIRGYQKTYFEKAGDDRYLKFLEKLCGEDVFKDFRERLKRERNKDFELYFPRFTEEHIKTLIYCISNKISFSIELIPLKIGPTTRIWDPNYHDYGDGGNIGEGGGGYSIGGYIYKQGKYIKKGIGAIPA